MHVNFKTPVSVNSRIIQVYAPEEHYDIDQREQILRRYTRKLLNQWLDFLFMRRRGRWGHSQASRDSLFAWFTCESKNTCKGLKVRVRPFIKRQCSLLSSVHGTTGRASEGERERERESFIVTVEVYVLKQKRITDYSRKQ